MPAKPNLRFVASLLVIVALALFPTIVRAATISNLFNTGVDPLAFPLLTGQVDTHYNLISPPSSTAVAVDNSIGSLISPLGGPWVANSATSRWIGPSVSSYGAGGNYDYQTSFTLPANAVLSTVNISGLWAVDDALTDVLINGNSTGPITPFYTPLSPFALPTGSYQVGTNTLEFLVLNADIGNNPTGLRIDGIKGTYRVIPEPGTASLAVVGMLICSALTIRQRTKHAAGVQMT